MENQVGKFTLDTSITFITRILQLVLGIGSSIVVARVLGPNGKGVYSLAILLPSLLMTFGSFGIGQASVFYIGKKQYALDEILGNNVMLSFSLGIVGLLVGLIIVVFLSESLFPGVAKIYIYLALLLVPLGFFLTFINYILLGLQKIKEFNFINILQSFTFLIILFAFLLTFKFGVKATIIANVLSCFVGAIVLFYLAKRSVGKFYLFFNKSYLKEAFKYGFKVYLGNIIGFLHYRIDIFLINIFLNPLAVGFYSIAVALAEKIWLVSQSAGLVLFPRVSSETDEKRLKELTPVVCRNVLLITSMGALFLFFLGRMLIIMFYSERFSDSVWPLQILLIGAVTMGGWRILANDLYGRGKPELNIYISLISTVLNIILNILWIPEFGIAGAAWATSVSYTFAFIVILIVYKRISGNSVCKTVFMQRADFILYKRLVTSVARLS
ncbi:MAG: flippase [Deltaproteobacteria bacterium]|nr:MAG: flippase [Deltaproteobacteria bacterium]